MWFKDSASEWHLWSSCFYTPNHTCVFAILSIVILKSFAHKKICTDLTNTNMTSLLKQSGFCFLHVRNILNNYTELDHNLGIPPLRSLSNNQYSSLFPDTRSFKTVLYAQYLRDTDPFSGYQKYLCYGDWILMQAKHHSSSKASRQDHTKKNWMFVW